ncbi:hypothetical protein CWI39_1004p0010 [Hamiltosporidium magnivora]|uniref:Uncharacterized protein n=1 Tax=Hamiltosporidium magnivora TaxID=148818 RepID=A0A4Q9L8Z5_9MICR|nr:hypothetical protein CWI39_1004p0010 [Hamiltosporidium magnivora]
MSGKDSNTMDDATSPKRAKRLTKYSTTWETSHPWSKEVKNNTFKAFCTICNKELSYAHGEISDKKHHAYSASHIYIIKTRSSSALSKFINKPNDTVLEFKISVSLEEITCVYHTVKHGLSSNSMDCGHKLLPTVCSDSKIAQKFSCGRTKATAIVSELAKESINEVLKSLKEKIHPFPLPMILAIRKTEKSESMKNDFLSFYSNFIPYLRKRYDFSDDKILSKLLFFNLDTVISYSELVSRAELLNIHVDEDVLYEEYQIMKPTFELIAQKRISMLHKNGKRFLNPFQSQMCKIFSKLLDL